jgi:hypothetical protein
MIISLADYYMGRDTEYSLLLSVDMRREAALTVGLANKMLAKVSAGGITIETKPDGTVVNSGWRPPAVNAATPGAAVKSKHLRCQAIDIYDPEGLIDAWCMKDAGLQALAEIGLWLEHPSSTKGWSHWQTVPPASGNRVFYP